MEALARAYNESGYTKKSLEVSTRLLRQNPEHATAWRLKALALEDRCGDQCRSDIDHAFAQWAYHYVDQSRQSLMRRRLLNSEYAQYLQVIPSYSLFDQSPE